MLAESNRSVVLNFGRVVIFGDRALIISTAVETSEDRDGRREILRKLDILIDRELKSRFVHDPRADHLIVHRLYYLLFIRDVVSLRSKIELADAAVGLGAIDVAVAQSERVGRRELPIETRAYGRPRVGIVDCGAEWNGSEIRNASWAVRSEI